MRTNVLMVAAALLAAPAALANPPSGPRNYCEDPSEWGVHDYVPPSDGALLVAFDGNLTGDCDGDTVPADYDGHLEWAWGGAILTAAAGDPAFPDCAIENPHHTDGTVYVVDGVFGAGVGFSVGADYDCDSIDDIGIPCTGSCDPAFPPGADGAFHVFVEGTWGRIATDPLPSKGATVVLPWPGSVVLDFAGPSAPPTVTAVGFSCSDPAPDGIYWTVECMPEASGTWECRNAAASITVSPGAFGGARVQCADQSASCTTGTSNSCVATIPGPRPFPLRCSAFVVGGTATAQCTNDP